jgi:hypothetical protein
MTVRFLTLYKPGTDGAPPPTEREMADMGRLIEEMTKSGILIANGGVLPSSNGARVRYDGRMTVVDGPLTEAKELVGGYAILEAKSKAEAIELTKRFLSVVRAGECEVREMWDAPIPSQAPTRDKAPRKEALKKTAKR